MRHEQGYIPEHMPNSDNTDSGRTRRALEALRETTRGRVTGKVSAAEGTDGAPGQASGVLTLAFDDRTCDYAYESRAKLRAEAIPALAARSITTGDRLPLMVITEHVGPAVAESAAEAGLNVIDAAGNAELRAPGLFVSIRGRKSKAAPSESARHRTTWNRAALPIDRKSVV